MNYDTWSRDTLIRKIKVLTEQLEEIRYSPCIDPETGDVISVEDFNQRH